MKLSASIVVAALGLGGCDYLTSSFRDNTFSGDPYPVVVASESGALVAGLSETGTTPTRTAVIDVLAPLTLIDHGPAAAQEFQTQTLTLYGATAPGQPLEIPRAQFVDKRVAILHPCSDAASSCEIGDPAAPRAFDAVVGMDSFASDALRLRLGDSELFIFPDIAGDDETRGRSCDAVFDDPFRGGGTVIFGGAEVPVPSRRIAIDTCIAPNPAGATQRERGLDALLVMSTAIGTSLLNESTYARYRELFPLEPELETLPESGVLLPSGLVMGRLTSVPSLALVGNLDSAPRAPCRQVYASHVLEPGPCAPGAECPCTDSNTDCAAPAIVELAPPSRIPVLIVADSDPTLQALRTELRPDRPEVDGILGTSALGAVELDIDLASSRMLARCVDRATCGARIKMPDAQARPYVTRCLSDQRGPFP